MGGNSFDHTERLSEEEYQSLCFKLGLIFERLNVQYRFPPEIKDKAKLVLEFDGHIKPYGDVDVIGI
jgi:hypothetical protein